MLTIARCALVLAVSSIILLAAPAAFAALEENTLGCAGTAVITSDGGEATTIDAADLSATLPRAGDAAWTASTAQLSKNHEGSVALEFGLFSYEIATWTSANDNNVTATNGVHTYDVPDWIPPFSVRLVGEHVAAGDPSVGAPAGTCSGYIDVSLAGDVFDSPVGIAVVALTGAFGLLFLSSGFARTP